LLGRLAGSVIALEQDEALAWQADENLRTVGAHNVSTVVGALAEGWAAGAPYDVIVVQGATETAPKVLLRQLKEGGRLVAVVGRAPATKGMVYLARGAQISGRPVFDAVAPLLPGFAEPPAFVF
jgi:protein-L-isoaspartate(D-aspartate) O-methyltransferase